MAASEFDVRPKRWPERGVQSCARQRSQVGDPSGVALRFPFSRPPQRLLVREVSALAARRRATVSAKRRSPLPPRSAPLRPALDALNEAARSDPDAIRALIDTRVAC